jgi:uncharacterized protein (TIGR02444 family)
VPSNPFWEFSLATYARPGVAEACLDLQDRRGLDVNLLLFCLWAGHCGHRLSTGELAALEAAAAPWRDSVVRPLRGVRRWLKQPADAGDAAAAALRREVQRLELAAERREQDLLHARLPLAASAPDPQAARLNLLACLGRDEPELETLLAGLE